MKVLAFVILLGLLLLFNVASTQAEGPSSDIHSRILDLQFHTEDLKGATQGLEVKETASEIKIELAGDILFDFDKWSLRAEAEPTLRQVAEVLTQHPRGAVLIEGHTDAKGTDSYNLPLSQKRADAVKAWLVNKSGVDGGRLATNGWGKTKPAAPNTNPDGSDNPDGRQKNRRVEVTVKK